MKRILLLVIFAAAASGQQIESGYRAWTEVSAPGNPASGYFHFYFKTGVGLCYKNSAGTETCPTAGGVGTHSLLSSATHTDTLTGTVILGDVIHGNATPAWARLAGNTTATKMYLSQTGNGSISAVPAWAQVAFADISGSVTDGQVPDTITASNYIPISTLTTEGDLLFRNATVPARLARGADGECLKANTTTIVWGACSAGGGITSLGGLTGATQTFGNDTNVTMVSSGTTHTLTWSGTLADSRVADALTLSGSTLATGYLSFQVANAGTTGTTVNTLAKLTGAPSTAVIAATTDVGGIIGVVASGAGTTGNAEIVVRGRVSCVFENATTAGNYVGIGTTTAGNCRDIGSSYPIGSQVIGRVLSTNGAAGTYELIAFGVDESITGTSTRIPFFGTDGKLTSSVNFFRDTSGNVENATSGSFIRAGPAGGGYTMIGNSTIGQIQFGVSGAVVGYIRMDATNFRIVNATINMAKAVAGDWSFGPSAPEPTTGLSLFTQGFALIGDISPTQITADQDNYNPTGLSTSAVLRLTSDASRNITGLAGGSDGRYLYIYNVGTNPIVLVDESASSTAGNRFALTGNITLAADAAIGLQYDSTTSRWRPLSLIPSAGGGITSLGSQTGATQTITRGAGIGGSSSGDDHAFTTASGEADFLASGALTCGTSTQGKIQVHTTPLQYCDNAATPVLQYAAYADSTGKALEGDTATAFFGAGALEKARQHAATVYNDAANTWSTGAQDFSAASMLLPISAGAGPTANGAIAYDSTANQLEYGDNTVNRIVANTDEAQTFTNKTLTAPTIGATEWTNANHAHAAANSGGTLDGAAIAAGTVAEARIHADLMRDSELAAFTVTKTNLTLDAEGTGNTLTTVSFMTLPAANCQGTTAFTAFATPTSNAPTPTCVTGTNTNFGVEQFPDTDGDYNVQTHFPLPPDWTGNIDVVFRWYTSATTGDIVWQLQTACAAIGETADPSWNTAQTVTDTAQGTANQLNDATISTVTTTGCAAGEQLFLKVLRNRTHASDSLAAAANLVHTRITLRRAQ